MFFFVSDPPPALCPDIRPLVEIFGPMADKGYDIEKAMR